MKRVIWGAALGLFGIFGFSLELDDFLSSGELKVSDFVLAGIFITVGVVLAGFGLRDRMREKQVMEVALRQLREEQGIDPYQISMETNMSEVDVRKVLVDARKKGILTDRQEVF